MRRTVTALVCAVLLAAVTMAETARKPEEQKQSSLPKVFASVLNQVKTKSHVAILLPSELPDPVGKAEHAEVDKATANEYAISLYYELGIGDAGFAALFFGDAAPKYDPRELGNVSVVELAHGIHGFFRAVSCGGSCAPANLWWKENGTLYQIQLKLPSTDQSQEKTMVAVANSAILGGPR